MISTQTFKRGENPKIIQVIVPESLAETIRRRAFEKKASMSKLAREALDQAFTDTDDEVEKI